MSGWAVIAVTCLVLLSACTPEQPADLASGPSSAAPAPATSASPSQTGADRAKQDALAAYLGMWQDFAEAGTTSDWQSSKLAQHAASLALTNLSRGLYADHYNGLVTKGEATHDARVMSAEPANEPTRVIVTDCSDSTNALKYRADNGQLADSTPGGRRLINGQVELQQDNSWKVTDFAVHEVGTC
ncbi:hypothetical protein ACFWQL_00880 [Amycolatopsis thermoflava]|uniref:hypothetical protein n=1 Tax=Amycolatopsis thermoflava TaxID=84480 RepID=UPI003667664B